MSTFKLGYDIGYTQATIDALIRSGKTVTVACKNQAEAEEFRRKLQLGIPSDGELPPDGDAA